jgi:hypothetical protein
MLGKGKVKEVRVIARKEAKLKELLLSGALDSAPERKNRPQSAVQNGHQEDVSVSLPSTTTSRAQEEDEGEYSEDEYSVDDLHDENENKSFIVSPMSALVNGGADDTAPAEEDEEGGNVLSGMESEEKEAQSEEKEENIGDSNWLSPIKQAPTPHKQKKTPQRTPQSHRKSPQRSPFRSPQKSDDDEFNF